MKVFLFLFSFSLWSAEFHMIPNKKCESNTEYILTKTSDYIYVDDIAFSYSKWIERWEHYPYTIFLSENDDKLVLLSYSYSSHVVDEVKFRGCLYLVESTSDQKLSLK